jgi:hypothetical protein
MAARASRSRSATACRASAIALLCRLTGSPSSQATYSNWSASSSATASRHRCGRDRRSMARRTRIVRIEPEQGKRHHLAKLAQNLRQQLLLAHQHRRAFRPARRNVGQRQCLHVAALRRRPAMRHQIRLHEAGRRIMPVAEGAHRDAAPDRRRRRRPSARPSSSRPVKQRAKLSRFLGETASNSFHPGSCDHPAFTLENLGCCSWIWLPKSGVVIWSARRASARSRVI